ncbi:MAG: 4-hydroxy-tetrahydrodipicolinate synthase, partial [Alistipes sp.]|nr:4-hydroxy-tetrahydrodipicolinate synthase [Alistipes sp.]
GNYDAAREAWVKADMDDAVEALFAEGNPVGAKCALSVMGKIGPTMRLPLVPGTPQLRERFKILIEKYDLH